MGFHPDDRLTVICGDALKKLGTLSDKSAHLICTSPPYWALRDYRVKGQIGLEETPEEHIALIVAVMREARRVLRDDGTLWINLGDTYARTGGTDKNISKSARVGNTRKSVKIRGDRSQKLPVGLRSGDLLGMPWRIALALQADGWILRRDNIWFKSNPMPESVSGWRWEKCRVQKSSRWNEADPHPSKVGFQDKTRSGAYHKGRVDYVDCPGCDKCRPNGGLVLRKGNWRCTTAHEYVFQFAKSDSYFCDAEAAREKTTGGAHARGNGVNPKAEGPNSRMHKSRVPLDRDDKPNFSQGAIRHKQNSSFSAAVTGIVNNRNRRSVWTIATAPYPGPHFATFPPELVRPIIQCASPLRCCAKCAAPYAPVVELGEPRLEQQIACGGDSNGDYLGTATKDFESARAENASEVKARILAGMVERKVIDHRPTCQCQAGHKPAVVLDMFAGSGTVGMVSLQEGRRAILIDIDPANVKLINDRCEVTPGLAIC